MNSKITKIENLQKRFSYLKPESQAFYKKLTIAEEESGWTKRTVEDIETQ
jgi:hypothetical protein